MTFAMLREEAVDFLKAAHPGQSVDTSFARDLVLRCDLARMQQALGKLLNNAVQHGDPSRPITVAARREDAQFVVTIANHGQPIPQEAYGRIFEPLFSLPPKRDESYERQSRVGLGLFIVKQIIEGHGGTVSVDSSVEQTTFTVCLPDGAQTDDRSSTSYG